MPTVIDALVVELGFDTAGMESGRKKVEDTFRKTSDSADNAGRKIDDSAKRTEMFLTKLRNNVVALFAAFTAGKGIKQFVSDMTAVDAALGRVAQTMNMTTHELALMQETARLFGIPVEDMTGSLKTLNDDLQDFRLTGQSNIIPWLRSMGIAVSDANNHLLPMDQLLMNLAKRADEVGDKPLFAAQLRHLGFGEGAIQLILQGSAALERLQAAAKPLADARTADVGAAQARLEAWTKLRNAWETTGVILLTKLTPAIVAITNALTAMADFFASHPTISAAAFAALAGALGLVTLALGAMAASSAWATIAGGLMAVQTVLKGVALGGAVLTETMLPALSEAFFALGLAIEATPIGWILTGVAAISAAIYLLVSHLEDLRKVWNVLTPSFLHIGAEVRKEKPAPGHNDGLPAWLGGGAAGPSRAPGGGGGQGKPAPGHNDGLPAWLGGGAAGPSRAPGGGGGQGKDAAAWAAAKASEAQTGIPAEVTYAQWALESGHGQHTPAGSNNPFGIKARAGQPYVEAQTKEFVNGQWQTITGRFAKFDSLADAFTAHAKLLANSPAYANARTHKNDPKAFADALTGVYATDPAYGEKLKSIIAREINPSDAQKAIARALAPGAIATAAAGASTSAQVASVANDNRSSRSSTSTSETKIGNLNVYSAAQNAAPMAGDIKQALERDDFVAQSNYGPA